MFLSDQEIDDISATSPSYLPPVCFILETVYDRITGTKWHKLKTNHKATKLIINNKAYSQWDLKAEITGKKYLWVTDKLLTLLHIQGLEQAH